MMIRRPMTRSEHQQSARQKRNATYLSLPYQAAAEIKQAGEEFTEVHGLITSGVPLHVIHKAVCILLIMWPTLITGVEHN